MDRGRTGRVRLRPGIWLLHRILKTIPSSIARMDEAALAGAQSMVLPDGGVTSLFLGRAQRGVEITRSGFDAAEGHRLPLRVYTPRGSDARPGGPGGARPLVVYFHGGGWALGSARGADWIASMVARHLAAVVVSVDYRLAPTHPFPAAVQDAYAALCWAAAHATDLGADPRRTGVMGESAGGNLAAVVSIMARDAGGPAVRHQALLYPATDVTRAALEVSYRNNPGIVLTNDDMDIFVRYYLPGDSDPADWRISPRHAPDLSGLPPAVIVVGGLDPLHDGCVGYARALAAAGVQVSLHDYPGMPHGFLNFPYFSAAARPAMRAIIDSQRKALSGPDSAG